MPPAAVAPGAGAILFNELIPLGELAIGCLPGNFFTSVEAAELYVPAWATLDLPVQSSFDGGCAFCCCAGGR